MARDRRVHPESEIPWWGYLVVVVAIAIVVVIGVVIWHVIALVPPLNPGRTVSRIDKEKAPRESLRAVAIWRARPDSNRRSPP
jgi:hypothetical protein